MPRTFRSFILIGPIIVFTSLLAFGALPRLFQEQSLVNHTKEQLAQAMPVTVVTAKPSPSVEEFVLPGTMQAIQDASIYARVDGYLRNCFVDIGDLVHTGQVLADIDTPELDNQVQASASNVEQVAANLENVQKALKKARADEQSAAANVRRAKTDLQYYTLEVGRYKSLAEEGAVSMEDRDSRIQAYNAGMANLDSLTEAENSAKASVGSAKAAVHVAEAALDAAQAQFKQIESTQSFKKVTALFDGIVTQRNVDPGALITSGSNSTNTILFRISRSDILRIYVYVPEQYVPAIQKNEKSILNVEEYPGRDFIGKVAHIAGGIDPTSKTLQVEVQIKNTDRKLLPGMYVQVRFQSPALERLAMVPATTAQTRADGCFMYTVDDKNLVHTHKVEIGRDLGGQFEISRGIVAGDKVIVSPPDELKEGLLVNPVNAPTPEKSTG